MPNIRQNCQTQKVNTYLPPIGNFRDLPSLVPEDVNINISLCVVKDINAANIQKYEFLQNCMQDLGSTDCVSYYYQ